MVTRLTDSHTLRRHCASNRIKRLLAWAIVVVVYYLWFQGFYNKIAYGKVIPYGSVDEGRQAMTLNFIPIALIFALNYLVVFVFTMHIKRISTKIAVDVAASFAALFIVNVAYMLILQHGVIDWAGTFFNNIFIFLGMEVAFYVGNYRKTVVEKERKHRQVVQYQYDALRAQVNPHFLFNSLNILYSLIDIDVDKSRAFVMSLSQMYRYIMQQHCNEKTSLSEELTFLHAYVDVLKMRYHNCLDVDIQGEENVGTHEVIPYCVQLLMENVTKHNVIQTNSPMLVSLVIGTDHLTISNPIRPKRVQEASAGIGLKYIAELYRLHGKAFHYDNDGKTFTATIPFIT